MKKIALLMVVVVYAASLTGCGCFRRVRGTLCRGAFCGTRSAPVLTPVRAPAPVPVVIPQQAPIVAAPQFVMPAPIQPQIIPYAPQCQCLPSEPTCGFDAPVCEPSYSGYGGDCGCYGGESGYSGFGEQGGCSSCNGSPYGIEVPAGEYLGGIEERNDSGWKQEVPTEAENIGSDPEPGA